MLTELQTCFALAPWFVGLWTFVIGACVGSFSNVVIYRLPIILAAQWRAMSEEYLGLTTIQSNSKFNLFYPSSACPNCKEKIYMWHNIPIISYLMLRGRCNHCQQNVSSRYFWVECISGLLATILLFKFGLSLKFLSAIVFCWGLLTLALIDWDTQLLPDELTIPLLWVGLIANTQQLFTSTNNSILSAAGAYMILYLFVKAFNVITNKDGMGHGDFKLFSVLGAWLGWKLLPFVLITASISGVLIGCIILKLSNQSQETPIAFGPYLCIAGVLALLFGDSFLNWYISYL